MIRPANVPFPGEILRRSTFCLPRFVLCAAMCALAARTAAAADPRIVTAAETRTPITLDGILDDEAWISAEPATDFVQAEPHEGQAATERTTVRLLFDRDALYVGVRCDDAMAAALIVNDIRKDFTPGEQDSFEVILDTFADRRNGFVFAINPAGAKYTSGRFHRPEASGRSQPLADRRHAGAPMARNCSLKLRMER